MQVAFPADGALMASDYASSVPEKAYVARAHQVNIEFIKGHDGY